MDIEQVEIIHESLINGQKKQVVRQIKIYGESNFFADYAEYLKEICVNDLTAFSYYVDITKAYFTLNER